MNIRIRQTLVAVAFAAVTAAGITGATLRGETKETDLAAACAEATWPMIPAACLEGIDANARYISANDVIATQAFETAFATNMEDRFAVAFQ